MSEAMDRLEAAVAARLDRLRALSADMAAIRERHSSPDGLITVAVDGNGALLELTLAPGIAALTPSGFERAVVDTAMSAARAAFARRAALITEFNAE
jgi:hypothetical protein